MNETNRRKSQYNISHQIVGNIFQNENNFCFFSFFFDDWFEHFLIFSHLEMVLIEKKINYDDREKRSLCKNCWSVGSHSTYQSLCWAREEEFRRSAWLGLITVFVPLLTRNKKQKNKKKGMKTLTNIVLCSILKKKKYNNNNNNYKYVVRRKNVFVQVKRHKSSPDGETVEFALCRSRLRQHRVEVAPLLNT